MNNRVITTITNGPSKNPLLHQPYQIETQKKKYTQNQSTKMAFLFMV